MATAHDKSVPALAKLSVLLGLLALFFAPQLRGEVAEEDLMGITVETPRPLAAALEILERRHGLAISYEDPVYEHASELDDVTESVRRDLAAYPKGQAPRVLVPKKGLIELSYPVTARGHLEDSASAIELLIAEHQRQDNAGHFKLIQSHGRFMVVPKEVKNTHGDWLEATSVLDTKISLIRQQRTMAELLIAIVEAAVAPRGLKAMLGLAPLGPMTNHRVILGARDQVARKVLITALASLESKPGGGGLLVWQLFYDPGLRTYVLNLHPAEGLARNATPQEGE